MATLEEVSSSRPNDKTNNFLLLRLIAASLVIYGHSFAIGATCSGCVEVFIRYIHYRYSGDIGVHIFFVISGYLVVASYDKRDNLGKFLEARVLRIIPAFWVCLLLMIVLGLKLTNLPLREFITNPGTWAYIKDNGLLLHAQFNLPGVKLNPNEKYGTVVNGSIWTLFVEARLYIIVAIAGAAGLLSKRYTANLLIFFFILIGIFTPTRIPFLGEYNENWRVAAFFAAGAFLYINRKTVPMNWGLLMLLLLASYLSYGTPNFDIFTGAFIAYGVVMVGYARKLPLPRWIEDYSYGIYIYGWPIQQLVRHYFPDIGPYRLTVISLILSWAAGVISWHILEKPILHLKPKYKPMV
ncbi:acyltransferase family protein [Acetobacter sp.]|uniref:acyltransferase family protein n=1 Tax=Acetobacter sp. TaxID=440 RepID=UPI0039EAA85C